MTGFVLLFGAAGYAWLGHPAGWAVGPASASPASRGAAHGAERADPTAAQVEAMVQRLAARLATQPEDVQGWAMLGRSYSVLGRHADAAKAWQQVARLAPRDAQALVDQADALASSLGGRLEGEPERLIRQALTIEPSHPMGLALSGTLAWQRGDRASAERDWARALETLEADTPLAVQVRSALQELRGAGARAGAASAPASR